MAFHETKCYRLMSSLSCAILFQELKQNRCLLMTFSIFGRDKKKVKKGLSDFYQESINKAGKEQFKKLVEKGLNIPVVLL